MQPTMPPQAAEAKKDVAQMQPTSGMNGTAETQSVPVVASRKENLLQISREMYPRFYERAAREHFASGHQEVELSALKSAVPLAITVALKLQEKKAATITKVQTKQVNFFVEANRDRGNGAHSSGITITLTRHPEFKGTRIIPSHIFFCPPLTDNNVWAYPESLDGVSGLFASVISGQPESMFSTPYGEALESVLKRDGQGNTEMQKNLQAHLFKQAAEANKDVHDLKGIKLVGEITSIKSYNPNLKAGFMRLSPPVNNQSDMTGSVFIEVFEDESCPHNNPTNGALIYLIAPTASLYKSSEEFLEAVDLAAANLMAALCDYNGYCRRGNPLSAKLKRIAVVRLGLFSHEPNVIYSGTTKAQIAEAILKGLNGSYHFGIAPKLQFFSLEDDDALRKAWLDQSGSEAPVRLTANFFGRRTSTEEQKE